MITEVLINDTMSGTVISPFPNGFLTKLQMKQGQEPAWQQESYLPYPFNRWTGGRFVLKDATGVLFNFATQNGALFASRILLNGSYAYRGDLFLECALKGQIWQMSISDTPVIRSQAA
jgi:hypothetical protein